MDTISVDEYKSLQEKMPTIPKTGDRYIKSPREENLAVGKVVWWLEVGKVEFDENDKVKPSKINIKVNMGTII